MGRGSLKNDLFLGSSKLYILQRELIQFIKSYRFAITKLSEGSLSGVILTVSSLRDFLIQNLAKLLKAPQTVYDLYTVSSLRLTTPKFPFKAGFSREVLSY